MTALASERGKQECLDGPDDDHLHHDCYHPIHLTYDQDHVNQDNNHDDHDNTGQSEGGE